MNNEIWKDVKNYEGLYQISNLGRVKSLISKNKILKPSKNKRGYMIVALSKNKIIKRYGVHQIVANNFIKNEYNKMQVNHIDGNKQNNCVENLEWCNCQENMLHAYKNKLTNGKRIPVMQLDLDGNLIKIWNSQIEASRKLNISSVAISRCCNGITKTAGKYIWKKHLK